ncbi:MAG: D-alanine--D-alanine ligase [Fluviicola sp.]|nr:D-alanine--D-alanine ligase [Fluviicola sp.]
MSNVAIICGGFSSEFDISVKSAINIQSNFPDAYNVFLVLLKKEGWFAKINEEEIPFDSKEMSFVLENEVIKIDFSIVYIHGDPGENGKVQAYLEMIDMPYVNSGPLASQLSFDKWYCNQFLKGFGFNVADSIYCTDANDIPSNDAIVERLGLPVFVKPCDSGSSYGISKVSKKEDINKAIKAAFKEGKTVIIEGFLDGTEVTCGVYRSKKGLIALPLTEIVSENDFFDFEAKYKGLSEEITPARISDELTKMVQKIAKDIYQLLSLRSIARVDFMVVNGQVVIIEVNTTPGFSNESIVPKMIEASGRSIKEFWAEIVLLETLRS